MESLLLHLLQHHLITSDEEYHLSSKIYSPQEKSQKLVRYLKSKGPESLQKFLCSLNLAHDHKQIADKLKQIADKLKQKMQDSGTDCDDFCSENCKKR